MIGRLREVRAARDERGYTITELLTVLVIMGVVMGGLTQIFVSGTKAENDMNQRYQSQQDTRLALDRIRRDIHCSSDATPYAQNSVTLKSTACGDVTWCTAAVTGPTTRYALYRETGTSCSAGTGLKVADYLTTANVFTSFSHPTGTLASLAVDFPISLKGTRVARYELKDTIYLRNSTRS